MAWMVWWAGRPHQQEGLTGMVVNNERMFLGVHGQTSRCSWLAQPPPRGLQQGCKHFAPCGCCSSTVYQAGGRFWGKRTSAQPATPQLLTARGLPARRQPQPRRQRRQRSGRAPGAPPSAPCPTAGVRRQRLPRPPGRGRQLQGDQCGKGAGLSIRAQQGRVCGLPSGCLYRRVLSGSEAAAGSGLRARLGPTMRACIRGQPCTLARPGRPGLRSSPHPLGARHSRGALGRRNGSSSRAQPGLAG